MYYHIDHSYSTKHIPQTTTHTSGVSLTLPSILHPSSLQTNSLLKMPSLPNQPIQYLDSPTPSATTPLSRFKLPTSPPHNSSHLISAHLSLSHPLFTYLRSRALYDFYFHSCSIPQHLILIPHTTQHHTYPPQQTTPQHHSTTHKSQSRTKPTGTPHSYT